MAPRGLSAAEKRVKMLEIFHETKEFYTLKELEKIAPKTKGITQQTVKETLDDLVSDGIVTFDKIGTSNYFWAFPSTAGAQKQAALDKAQNELSDLNKRIAETKAGIISESKGREDTPERQKLLSALQQAHTDRVNLTNELAAYGAADPVKYERKKEAIQVCKDAAVRWTDNTLTVISFLQAQGAEREMIRSMLEDMGIPDQDEWEDLKL